MKRKQILSDSNIFLLDMFKAALLGFALVCGSEALNLKHELDLDIENLSDLQNQANNFINSNVPGIKGAQLLGGEQDGNVLKFEYLSDSAPTQLTQVNVEQIQNQNDEAHPHFKIVEILKTITGPIDGGSITKTVKSYAVDSFSDALENLDWN